METRFYYLAREVATAGVDGDDIAGAYGAKRWTRGDARRILPELLNCRPDAKGMIQFTKRYGPLVSVSPSADGFRFQVKIFLQIQILFRAFWEAPADGPVPLPALQAHAPGERAALWYRLRGRWATESLLNWLAVSAFGLPSKLFRKCAAPNCPGPYFVATRRARRFCSDECALNAKRSAGLEWWRAHGEAWRAGRDKRIIGKKSKRALARRKGKAHGSL